MTNSNMRQTTGHINYKDEEDEYERRR
jgi:hypothetical protein